MQTRSQPAWDHPLIVDHVVAGRVLAGVDEVGRGAWAGPVVAGATIMTPGTAIAGLNDSKLLTAAVRRRLDRDIRREALAVGLGWVSAVEVDAQGLSWAVRESGLRALAALELDFDLVLLDGKHNYLAGHHPAVTLVKADQLLTPVAAASVVAKVARDHYMELLGRRYPGYGFAAHKGYGTAVHAAALAQRGATAVHRQTWAPLRKAIHVND
jgi:ribonuclease HII